MSWGRMHDRPPARKSKVLFLTYGTDGEALVNALATGKTVIVSRSVTEITLTTSAQVLAVLPYLYKLELEDELQITLPTGIFQFTSGAMVELGSNSNRLKLVGAAPIPLTMTSVASITGSSGGYTITYNISSSLAGVSVGLGLKNYETAPLAVLNGDNSDVDVLRRRPLANELYNPVYNLGAITCTASATTTSFAGGADTVANCLAVGDLLTVNGQTRVIDGLSPVTVSVAWDYIGASAEDHYFVTLPNSGTVSAAASTTLTGASTAFLTEANVGDELLAEGERTKITAIANDGSLTLAIARTYAAGTPYSILTPGVYHDGVYEITAVGASTVSVYSRSFYKPPINKVVGGSMRVLTTVLEQNGATHGVRCLQGAGIKWLDRIYFLGSRSGATPGDGVGILMNGKVPALPLAIDGVSSFGNITQHGYGSELICGPDLGVGDWVYNVFLGHGCTLNARMSAFSGANTANIFGMEHSFANLRRASITGSTRFGLAMNAGSGALLTEVRIVGNLDDGVRLDENAEIYAEAGVILGNGVNGVRANGAAHVKMSRSIIALSGSANIYALRGIVNVNECVIASAGNNNIDSQYAIDVSADNSWITGAVSNGINNVGGRVKANNAAVTGNKNIGVYGDNASKFFAASLFTKGNLAATVRFDDGSKADLPGASIADLQVSGSGVDVSIVGLVSPAPTITGVARRNEYTKDFSVVRDGAATSSGAGFAGVRLGGGANLAKVLRASGAIDCPSIPANGAVIVGTLTVTGAVVLTMGAIVNSNYVNADVSFTAQITAADTVTIVAHNGSAGAINPGNATYYVACFQVDA